MSSLRYHTNNGVLGSSAAPTICETAKGAVNNAITMYSRLKSLNALIDVNNLRINECKPISNQQLQEGFNYQQIVKHYDPICVELTDIFWNKAAIFVFASWSARATDYTYNREPYLEKTLKLSTDGWENLNRFRSLFSGR